MNSTTYKAASKHHYQLYPAQNTATPGQKIEIANQVAEKTFRSYLMAQFAKAKKQFDCKAGEDDVNFIVHLDLQTYSNESVGLDMGTAIYSR